MLILLIDFGRCCVGRALAAFKMLCLLWYGCIVVDVLREFDAGRDVPCNVVLMCLMCLSCIDVVCV